MASIISIEKGVAQARGSRPYQEDDYAIDDDKFQSQGIALYSVFDGHGGKAFANHASNTLPKILFESDHFKNGEFERAIKTTFLEEDKTLAQEVVGEQQVKKGGTTATAALLANGSLYVGNVGDSRAVLAERQDKDANGTLLYNAIRLSKDHKVTDQNEATRLDKAGAFVRGDRVVGNGHAINMSRALGDFDFKEPKNEAPGDWISPVPHISTIKLEPKHDFLVLASDGLWTYLDEYAVIPAVAELRANGATAQQIAEKFVEKLGKVPGSDNTTVIVLFFKWQDSKI